MDMMLVLWALSAALLLGVMMLVVVMIARGMDTSPAKKPAQRADMTKLMAALGGKSAAESATPVTGSSGKSGKRMQENVAIGAVRTPLPYTQLTRPTNRDYEEGVVAL